MSHNNRLHVFFLFIVFAVGVGFPAPKQARGLENPPQNYEVPPSIPLQIVNLSVSPEPLIGQTVTLHIEIMSIYAESNVTIWVVLPEGVELVSGSLEWQGSLTANHLQTHELSIRVLQEGDWRLRIGAFSTLSANNGYQDTETLHLISDFNSTNIVPGREYRITQPLDGMPGPTIPAKDISITTLPNPGTGQVTIEGQFKFEATEIKSLGTGNVVTNDVERAKVEVWDTEATGNRFLTVMAYDPQTKKYTATMPNIDPDGTGIDPRLRFYATDGERVEVVDEFDNLYFYDFDLSNEIGSNLTDGTYTAKFTMQQVNPPKRGDFNQVLYIFDKTANDAYEFLQSEAPSWGGENHWVQINYPEGCVGNDSGDPCFTGQIFIPDAEGYEPDVILHEYGHFAFSEYMGVSNIIDACSLIGFKHDMWKPTNITCAWSEGWANFFEMAVQNEADYRGYNLEDVETDLQHNVTGSYPEVYEGVVSATLWDFFEIPASGVSEKWDELADGFNGPIDNGIWHFSTTYFPIDVPVRSPLTLAEFWNVWRNERPNGACLGSVILQHHKLDDFEPFVRTLTTSVSPSGGGSISINPAPNCPEDTYLDGTNITLSANAYPSSGYYFQQWLGDASGNTNPLPVVMDADKDIIADFNSPTATPTSTVTVTPTLTPATPTPCTHWDLVNDFRISPYAENPNRDSCGNPGVWEFMSSGGFDRSNPLVNYYDLPDFDPNAGGYLNLNRYSTASLFPHISKNAGSEISVVDGSNPIVVPANSINVHPAPGEMAVIAWHSLIDGYIAIHGGVIDNSPGCGDGIEWYLDKNTTSLAYGGYINGASQEFAAGYGGAELSAVEISAGDTIYLAIHPKGDYYCDDGQVNFSIDVTGAPTTATPTPLNGPTSTDLPPNFTPSPGTSTPYPTPTLQSTSEPNPPICVLNVLYYILFGQITPNDSLITSLHVMPYIQQAVFDIQLFHRVEDEVLSQTLEGQHYIDLYYEHGAEIVEILTNNLELRNEAVATLQLWEPNLQALVDGQGGSVIVTSGQVQAIQTFLDHLYTLGSPELRQTIDSERALDPLENTIGMSMEQASVQLIDYQPPAATSTATVTPTPTEAFTFTPSPTLTPSATLPPAIYTIVLQPNGTDGMDTYLLSGATSSNYGGNTGMGIGEKNSAVGSYARALIKFDLSTLPADAVITSASLSLWASIDYADSDGTINVYRLKKPFNETQATWNLSATGENWQAPGAAGVEDRESIAIGSAPISANETTATEKQIILSPEMIQEMFDGTFANHGFLLATAAELNDRFDFKTSDTGSGQAGQRPKLVIQYTSASTPPVTTPPLFADNFETGDLSTWSITATDGGDLSVSPNAALMGFYGMQAVINDTTPIYVTDYTPLAETEYRAGFAFDPNSVTIPNNNNFVIATATDTIGTAWRVTLNYSAGVYKLQGWTMNDAGAWVAGTPFTIQDAPQLVEVKYKSAAGSGFLEVWIDGVLADTISNLDNATRTVGSFSLGAVNGLDAGTSGTIYFDMFESYKNLQ